jgi:hypothetical protein
VASYTFYVSTHGDGAWTLGQLDATSPAGPAWQSWSVKPGDELVFYDEPSDTTLVCFLASGQHESVHALDELMLSRLSKRLATLQRLVDEERASREQRS